MGDRMDNIHPGAMPWLHRYVGNPCSRASSTSSSAPASRTRTAGCGPSARDVLPALDLRTTGWSSRPRWSSAPPRRGSTSASSRSSITRAAASRSCRASATAGATCASCSSTARRTCSSSPALVMALLGALDHADRARSALDVFGRVWDVHAMIAGALLMIVGIQVRGLGLCAHAYGTYFMGERDRWFDRMRARFRLEHGLLLGGVDRAGRPRGAGCDRRSSGSTAASARCPSSDSRCWPRRWSSSASRSSSRRSCCRSSGCAAAAR